MAGVLVVRGQVRQLGVAVALRRRRLVRAQQAALGDAEHPVRVVLHRPDLRLPRMLHLGAHEVPQRPLTQAAL